MVPAFIQRHMQSKIFYNHSLKYQFIVFDTKTTSLGKEAHMSTGSYNSTTYVQHQQPRFPACKQTGCQNCKWSENFTQRKEKTEKKMVLYTLFLPANVVRIVTPS